MHLKIKEAFLDASEKRTQSPHKNEGEKLHLLNIQISTLWYSKIVQCVNESN